jgi:hypothetical protein
MREIIATAVEAAGRGWVFRQGHVKAGEARRTLFR